MGRSARHSLRSSAIAAAPLAALVLLLAAASAQAAPLTVAPYGSGAGKVDRPVGTAVDHSNGDLYVGDDNNARIDKFDSEGNFLEAWAPGVADNHSATLQTCGPQASPPTIKCFPASSLTSPGPGYVDPEGIAVDQSSHDLYVADPRRHRITKFTANGELLFMIGKGVDQGGGVPAHPGNICKAEYLQQAQPDTCGAGGSGTGAGEYFGPPTSVTVDSSGNLWVGDDGRVLEFDSEGGFVSEAKVPGGGGIVKGIAIDPLVSGELWMKSQSLAGVRRYALSGSPPLQTLSEVGSPLDLTGEPEALVLDSAGDVYLGDKQSPYRFKAYDPSGELFSQFGAGQVIGRPGAGGAGHPGGTPLALDETAHVLYAASSASGPESAVQRFALPEPGPLPEEPSAGDLLPTTATLKATLNPEGHATAYRFQYLTRAAYEQQGDSFEGPATEETDEETLPGSGFENEAVSAALDHLIPGTEYRFRLLAENEKGQNEAEASFATPKAVGIEAQWTEQVAAASALFEAELDPFGEPAEWRLEYGTSDAYGKATEFQPIEAGFGAVPVAAQVTGLSPDTLYHYRFVAKDVRDGLPYLVEGPDQVVLTALGALGFELPDDRAPEQVSPLHKGGGRIVPPWLGLSPAAADGSAFSFISVGPVSAAAGDRFPEPAQSLARRGAGGWTSQDIEPPHETAQPIDISSEYKLFSSDLARAALEPRGLRVKQPGPLSEEASEWSPYLRENLADPVRWRPLLTGKTPYANVCPGTEFGGKEAEEQLTRLHSPISVVGASPDLRHVIVKPAASPGLALTCDAEGGLHALYEWSAADGSLQLVSRLPADEGGEVAVSPTLGSSGHDSSIDGSVRGAVSEDGRYVYWERPENAPPTELYLRDTAKEETVRLDVPEPLSFGGADRPIFQGASADGTRAFFTDSRHLTPDAGEAGADLYECELVESGGEDECLLQDLTPETEARESAGVQGMVSALGEAGEDLYFVADGKLAPGAVSGDCAPPTPSAEQRCNLYHAHRGAGGSWSTDLVAVLSGADWPDWAGGGPGQTTAQLVAAGSPSGRYLAFMSQLPLTGYDSRDAKSGRPDEEAFRYDAASDSLACVSCAPSGARPHGVVGANGYQLPSDWQGIWTSRRVAATLPDPEAVEAGVSAFYHPRAMLDNGRVLFNAFDSLVPADSNGTADAYEYEPWGAGSCSSAAAGPALAQAEGGGCVALLSSGTSERESAVIDSSATGEDVFIITASRLSALDEDPDYDIYDVRVGGVPAKREVPAECLGEACQSPAAAPAAATPPTAALSGDGNLQGRPPKRRSCPQGKRKVKRRGEVRCVSRHRDQKPGKHRHGRAR